MKTYFTRYLFCNEQVRRDDLTHQPHKVGSFLLQNRHFNHFTYNDGQDIVFSIFYLYFTDAERARLHPTTFLTQPIQYNTQTVKQKTPNPPASRAKSVTQRPTNQTKPQKCCQIRFFKIRRYSLSPRISLPYVSFSHKGFFNLSLSILVKIYFLNTFTDITIMYSGDLEQMRIISRLKNQFKTEQYSFLVNMILKLSKSVRSIHCDSKTDFIYHKVVNILLRAFVRDQSC